MRISAVINTRNEERNIVRCLRAIHPFVEEIVVVDMESKDRTRQLARKFTKKIYTHKNVDYVEPARNFAIEKATGDWIILLDADEIVPEELGLKFRRLVDHATYEFYRIPRKNLIFGRWVTHSGWWPDYHIRFFKKGIVRWENEIHSIPTTYGKGMDLQAEEKNALIHYHYDSIAQYLERLNRYTTQEVNQLISENATFSWKDMLTKPAGEFMTRYFAWEGYKDGLLGLALSILQAISFFVVQLKLWEAHRFNEEMFTLEEMKTISNKIEDDMHYWFYNKKSESATGVSKLLYKIRAKSKV